MAVARALVLEPELLLFDEPLSNLDAKLRRRVRELQQKLGITSIYVTHDQEEALAVSDRIIMMSNAAIAQIAPPRQLYEEPASRFIADFIGDANVVRATIQSVDKGRAAVAAGGLQLDLPCRGLPPGPALLAIRRRAIRLMPSADQGGVKVQIAKSAYFGSHMEYEVEGVIGELFVIDSEVGHPLEPGSQAWLTTTSPGVTLIRPE